MVSDDRQTPEALHFDRIGRIAGTAGDLGRAPDFYTNTLGPRQMFDAGAMPFVQCGEI